MTRLNAAIPEGPLADKWTAYHSGCRLVSPGNKRKLDIIVVGTGLAGASAAASLGELGYNVKAFCYQDTPRRAHSIAAQGGINAAKNYPNDGDSVHRLFHDTVKGGDYRAREGNVYRLSEVSNQIIDLAVARGFLLRVNTEVFLPTARSEARRYQEPFMRAARPASSFCSVPMGH